MDSADEHDDDVDMGSDNPSARPANKATLKRGDACLACRRRRIRCNAEKPSCATCTRLKKQCIYETGKTTSRIALLKARVADLEEELQIIRAAHPQAAQAAQDSKRPPAHLKTSPATAPPVGVAAETLPDPSAPGGGGSGGGPADSSAAVTAPAPSPRPAVVDARTVDPASLAFCPPTPAALATMVSSMLQTRVEHRAETVYTSSQGRHGPGSTRTTTTTTVEENILHNSGSRPPDDASGFMSLAAEQLRAERTAAATGRPLPASRMPYPQSTNPRPWQTPATSLNFDLSFLDPNMSDLSASMFTMGQEGSGAQGGAPPGTHSAAHGTHDPTPPVGLPSRAPSSTLSRVLGFAGVDADCARLQDLDDPDGTWTTVPHGELSILPSVPEGRAVVGGWFDPNEVPPGIRDHLLDLFFSKNSVNLIADITVYLPRFYTRLTLPPSKRPHPGLMYSIYATAARMSCQPSIKQLETQFFEIAEKQIRLAVGNHDRLIDAVRAMALLTNYLFGKEKYSLGYHMCGSAVRLAISCGLDRIPSSVWAPPPPFNVAIHCTLRMGGYSVPPPEDPQELAERIYAFWSVFEMDLCTAIAYLWHTGLPIEDIRTPFPRPLFEYEIGLVSTRDDISINSVLEPIEPGPGIDPAFAFPTSFLVLRMKALTLLARVHKLRQEKAEVPLTDPDLPTFLSSGPHACSYPGSSQPAFATHPTGFMRLKRALDHFCDHLPDEHRAPWRWDEGSDLAMPRVALTRETSVIHFLVGNAYMQLWNVRTLDATNAVALLVARRLVNVMYLYQTEPLSTGYDIFMITIWNEVAMVLVREVKRRQHYGDTAGAAEMDADLGVAITSLKKWGNVNISKHDDGADIAAINGKMLEQLRLMSGDDWAEAMDESRRRYGMGDYRPPVAT